MPGANNGTGQPIHFRCSACRKRGARERGYRDEVRLTGNVRHAPHGTAGIRNSAHSRQYRCLNCGHVGWSRHVDLERLYNVVSHPIMGGWSRP